MRSDAEILDEGMAGICGGGQSQVLRWFAGWNETYLDQVSSRWSLSMTALAATLVVDVHC